MVQSFQSSVESLLQWLRSADTYPALEDSIVGYLKDQGSSLFTLAPAPEVLRPHGLLTCQNNIGFNNFLIGLTSTTLEKHQDCYYQAIGSTCKGRCWNAGLINALLSLVRSCWLKRNQ
eukprot:13966092-Ditylum_brightwellii.AAC.1